MKVTDPINDRQLAVLRWIAAGCPEGVMHGNGHKASAMALHHRKLVKVSRKGGQWRATVTSDGEYYLAHGQHRPRATPLVPAETIRPAPRAEPAAPSVSAPAVAPAVRPAPAGGKAAALVEEVVAAGGRLLIPGRERDNLSTLVQAANRFNKVPPGTRLASTWTRDGTVVYLNELPEWARTPPPTIAVPAQLRRPHPAVAALAAKGSDFGILGPARRRGLLLLQALAHEASARGHQVRAGSQPRGHYRGRPAASNANGRITIVIGTNSVYIRLSQEHDKVPHTPTKAELRDAERSSWVRIPEWDRVPTERLTLTLDAPHRVRQDRWSDSTRSTLETVLGEALQEVELRCAAADAAQLERERQAELRRQRWEAAMAEARQRYVLHFRTQELQRQAAAHRSHRELAEYVDAVKLHAEKLDAEPAAAAQEWVSFALEHLQATDPLLRELRLPDAPDPGPSDLQPFLRGWTPTAQAELRHATTLGDLFPRRSQIVTQRCSSSR